MSNSFFQFVLTELVLQPRASAPNSGQEYFGFIGSFQPLQLLYYEPGLNMSQDFLRFDASGESDWLAIGM